MQWDLAASDAESFGIKLGGGVSLFVDTQAQRLCLERDFPMHGIKDARSIALPPGKLLDLRIFIDRSSVEVFVNQGGATFSSRIYPQPGQRALSVFATNGKATLVQGDFWTLSAG